MSSTQIIIAALNEEEGIGLTIAEIFDTLNNPHVLVVDGRSSDRTVEVAKDQVQTFFFKMDWVKEMRWRRQLRTWIQWLIMLLLLMQTTLIQLNTFLR